MIRYNEKYDRWVTTDGKIYRQDKKTGAFIELSYQTNNVGYIRVRIVPTHKLVHRMVWETFKGEIPNGYEIDHINTIKSDNRLENLRCVTHKENTNNPLTRKHNSEALKGNKNASGNTISKGKTRSEFGKKFKEHYGITYKDDPKLYRREMGWYRFHNKVCRWE